MKKLEISEVSRLTGHAASALRYYELIGLIVPSGRIGIRRTYLPEVLDRLAIISLGRAAGFSLQEIGEVFLDTNKASLDREKLRAKAGELDEIISRLKDVRDGLLHTAECKAPSHMECPNFQRILKAARLGLVSPLDVRLGGGKG